MALMRAPCELQLMLMMLVGFLGHTSVALADAHDVAWFVGAVRGALQLMPLLLAACTWQLMLMMLVGFLGHTSGVLADAHDVAWFLEDVPRALQLLLMTLVGFFGIPWAFWRCCLISGAVRGVL